MLVGEMKERRGRNRKKGKIYVLKRTRREEKKNFVGGEEGKSLYGGVKRDHD
jgi:hypothetical protein